MKEGDIKLTKETCVSQECDQCGERATKKLTFLYDSARRNPASSAYGKDDCSWCSDYETFSCNEHADQTRQTPPDGMGWCSTFDRIERFERMFLYWHKEELKEKLTALEFMQKFSNELERG